MRMVLKLEFVCDFMRYIHRELFIYDDFLIWLNTMGEIACFGLVCRSILNLMMTYE